MNSKIATFDRKIEAKEYYEAHQYLRTQVNRLLKAKQRDSASAITLLVHGALVLLRCKQAGSGLDLSQYLLKTYAADETPIDACRDTLLNILKEYKDAAARKQYVHDLLDFFGSDVGIHKAIGRMYLYEEDLASAVRHLLIGSCTAELVDAIYENVKDEVKGLEEGAARIVFGYLFMQNVKEARHAISQFSRLCQSRHEHNALPYEEYAIQIFPTLPLLSFLTLLVLCCEKRSAQAFARLRNEYSSDIAKGGEPWRECVGRIGEIYFEQRPAKGNNIFADLVGSLFNPASSGGSRSSAGAIAGSTVGRGSDGPGRETLD